MPESQTIRGGLLYLVAGPAVRAGEALLFTPLPPKVMTDDDVNYWNMAREVRKLLGAARPQWEPLYQKLVPDYARLDTALGSLDGKLQKLTGQGSTGFTRAKDQAEIRTLDAAVPVLQGLKALAHDGEHPTLAKLAKHTRSSLDDLRGPTQVAALEELHTQAVAFATDLAGEMVSATITKKLGDEIALYKPLLGTPNEQIHSTSLLRDDSVALIGEARKALKGLDIRVPNLKSALPDLVAAYAKARQINDAGHGPKNAGTTPQA